MKAKVYVTLKSGVLDPQGKAIQHSVELLGFSGISDVRQGKYFEISLDGSMDNASALESIEKMARGFCSEFRAITLTELEIRPVEPAVRYA